ncbi:hypothetical protein CHAN_02075 [Corynebacterium hansenii]|nr:hypothetical protein CHAN_02075 [Corynebacterium hansenii]
MVLARRTGAATRSLHDPVLGAAKDQGATGLVLDGSRDDGPLMGVALRQRPPGRGTWVEHGKPPRVMQVALPPEEKVALPSKEKVAPPEGNGDADER